MSSTRASSRSHSGAAQGVVDDRSTHVREIDLDASLARIPLSDWRRMWAMRPAHHLPRRIGFEVSQSMLEVSTYTYQWIAAMGVFSALLAALTLVPLDRSAGRLWVVLHLLDSAVVAVVCWVVGRLRRRGGLTVGRVNLLFAPTVVWSAALWGTLPAVVGTEPIGPFYLALCSVAMLGFFGFFWTTGNWPLSIAYTATILTCANVSLWYLKVPGASTITGLMVMELLVNISLSFLATYALVSSRCETILARERKQMVRLLLRDYERGGHDWVWAVDDRYRFTHVPPRMEHATGGDSRFRSGMSLLDLLADDQAALAAIEADEPFQSYIEQVVGDRQVQIRLWGRPNIVGRRCLGYLGVGSDENARLRSSQAELTRERLDAMVAITGGLAHDFNNLLATILGSIEVCSIGLDVGGDIRPHLERAADACLRTRRITADLVAAAGYDHTSEPEPFDVSEAVGSVLDDVRPVFPAIDIVLVDTDRPLWVLADRNHFMRTARNLIDNACHAISSQPGRIEPGLVEVLLQADRDDDGLPMGRLTVRDDGPGIPGGLRKRLFEPFFTTRKATGGTGLGLAVASGFARQSGGTLRLEPTQRGATFSLSLPVAPLVEVNSAKTSAAAEQPGHSLYDLSGRILVVEDDQHLGEAMVAWLSGLGADADVVGSVHEAIEYLDEADLDVACVISDIVLPDGEGYDVVAELRKRRPHAPAVYVSGFTATLPAHVIAELRCPFVAKPFSSPELLRALNQAGVSLNRPPSMIAHDSGTGEDHD